MENWIKKQAALAPTRTAVTNGTTSLSFAQLAQTTAQLDRKLAALGALKGQRVALLTDNSLAGYLTAMALLNAGKTIVWLNRRLSAQELNYQLADSQVTVCLYEDQLDVNGLNCQTISLSQVKAAPEQAFTACSDFNTTAAASIMYTSGTTGQPKGVVQTFGNHFSSATASALNLGVTPADEWLCTVPIFHISGFSIMMRGLIYGMTVRLTNRFDAEEIHQMLVNEPITMISVVPYMLKKLLAVKQAGQASYNQQFRGMLLGGGPIDQATLKQCQELNISVVQSYGMTETCSQIVALSFADAPQHIGSSGKPLFLTQLRLAEDTNEIQIKTPALSPAYLGQPEKRAAKTTADGWFKTGDIGHFDADGFLYIHGRGDDMIISGGENIFPDEVEAAYAQCPFAADIAVIGVNDDQWEQKPVAFVIPNEQTLLARDLIDYGRERLAHYKVPKNFYLIDQFPRNASGKLQRFKLRQFLDEHRAKELE